MAEIAPATAVFAQPAGAHRGRGAGGRRRRSIGTGLAAAWLLLVVVAALLADFLPLADPNAVTISDKLAGPLSPGHFLGSDGLGRDILARLAFGSRVSLVVGAVSVIVGSIVGGSIGIAAGYRRGRFDALVMGLLDVVLAFPALVLLLALVAVVGQSLTTISMVIGLLAVPFYARVARAATMQIRSAEYVTAARVLGVKPRWIVFGEIVPNVLLPIVTFAAVAMAAVVVLEGSLAFLNLSVEPPTATWGAMITEGKRHLADSPHVVAIPSAALFLTVLALNVLGQAARSHADDRSVSF